MQLTNSFEGGSHGTSITTGNSGGASGDAFNAINGTAPIFSSTHAMHGSLAMDPGTGTNGNVQWTLSPAKTQIWGRGYYYFTGSPTAAYSVVIARNGASNLGLVKFNTSRQLQVGEGATLTTFTSTIPTNAWFRVEFRMNCSGTTISVEGRLWLTPDSAGAADETQTQNVSDTTANMDAIRFGTNVNSTFTPWTDDILVNDTGFPGPAVTTASGVATSALMVA